MRFGLFLAGVMMTKRQQLSLKKWRGTAACLQDISSEYIAMFELKLNCTDWRETMKTSEWKYPMIKMVVKLMRLERYF